MRGGQMVHAGGPAGSAALPGPRPHPPVQARHAMSATHARHAARRCLCSGSCRRCRTGSVSAYCLTHSRHVVCQCVSCRVLTSRMPLPVTRSSTSTPSATARSARNGPSTSEHRGLQPYSRPRWMRAQDAHTDHTPRIDPRAALCSAPPSHPACASQSDLAAAVETGPLGAWGQLLERKTELFGLTLAEGTSKRRVSRCNALLIADCCRPACRLPTCHYLMA